MNKQICNDFSIKSSLLVFNPKGQINNKNNPAKSLGQPKFYQTSQSIKDDLTIFSRSLKKKLIANPAMRNGLTKFLLQPTIHPCLNIIQSLSKFTADCASTHATANGQERFSSSARFTVNKPLILSSGSTIPNIWSTQLLLGGYNIYQMHRGGLQWRSSLGFSMYYRYGFKCSTSLVYPS